MVFLYIPNVIDYFRFVCLFTCIFLWKTHPYTTVFFYILNHILDEFDGRAARRFNQSSSFGGILDMVCDRSSDAVWLSFLCQLYPNFDWVFYGIMVLDICSHWILTYQAAFLGKKTHKNMKTEWRLLQIYYSNGNFLNFLLYGCVIFYSALYLHALKDQIFYTQTIKYFILIMGGLFFPTFLLKHTVNFQQLIYGSTQLAEHDMKVKLGKT